MSDPFRIEGPACISFSGGRTSAYMLRRILDAHGRAPPEDVHVLFQNTGKERPETLDFIHEIEVRWNVRVRWLEYRFADGEHTYAEVCYATASRRGEPFEALIGVRDMLPNPAARLCTQELKARVAKRFCVALGWESWTNVIGLRADEPRRVAKANAPQGQRWENDTPLASAGITERDVLAFWASQPFDLRLMSHEGNCDLCFLKSAATLTRIIRARPDLAEWWIGQEAAGHGERGSSMFRNDRPPYRRLLAMAQSTPLLPGLGLEDPSLPCACTD